MNQRFFESFRACGCGGILAAALLFSSAAQAQCTKDTDCAGARVCESNACVLPANATPESVPVPADAPAVTPAPAAAPRAHEPAAAPTRTKMRSLPLVLVGAATSSVGLGLMVFAGLQGFGYAFCEVVGGAYASGTCQSGALKTLALGAGVAAVGIPLVIIGAKRVPDEPTAQVALVPVAVPKGAGFGLRLEL